MNSFLIMSIELHSGEHIPYGISDDLELAVQIVEEANNKQFTHPYNVDNGYYELTSGTLIESYKAKVYYVKPLPLWRSNA